MRAIVQRVKNARIEIDKQEFSAIRQGLLILICVMQGDTVAEAEKLAYKIANLRIFEEETGKMKYNVKQIDGEVLSISQFTLAAGVKKGHRPNFSSAEEPMRAEELYQKFNHYLESYLDKTVSTGKFGADMQVELCNDGPVTIIYDTDDL